MFIPIWKHHLELLETGVDDVIIKTQGFHVC